MVVLASDVMSLEAWLITSAQWILKARDRCGLVECFWTRWRDEDFALILNSMVEASSSWDQYQLQVCRIVCFEMIEGTLVPSEVRKHMLATIALKDAFAECSICLGYNHREETFSSC